MSGLRSSAVFGLRRPRLSGARSRSAAAQRRVELLDELDLGALEEAVKLLDISLVEVQLRHRAGDLGEGQDAELLTARDEALDLFEFLQFRY